MDGATHPAPVGCVSAPAFRVVGAMHFGDVAIGVLHHVRAGNQAGVAQADFLARGQPVEPSRRVLHEIVALDVNLASERHAAGAHAVVFGVVNGLELFALLFRVVGNHHLQRIQHGHAPLGSPVQVIAQAVFQQRQFGDGVAPGDADPLTHVADGLGRVAPPTQCADGGHPGVIPTCHVFVLHQPAQHPLAHHRVGQIEAGELDLPAAVDAQDFLAPIVQRAVVLKLKGAQRVRDALDRVGQ